MPAFNQDKLKREDLKARFKALKSKTFVPAEKPFFKQKGGFRTSVIGLNEPLLHCSGISLSEQFGDRELERLEKRYTVWFPSKVNGKTVREIASTFKVSTSSIRENISKHEHLRRRPNNWNPRDRLLVSYLKDTRGRRDYNLHRSDATWEDHVLNMVIAFDRSLMSENFKES